MSAQTGKRIAVVAFQLGGPDSLDAVEPFLYNLFCDPDIINFPGAFLARKALARYISSKRSPKVAEHYKEIGGKSPIRDLTTEQASSLERVLRESIDARVYVAMRYWHPFTEEAISEMQKRIFDKIVLLPLYPHYSMATTLSSIKEWNKQSKRLGYKDIPTVTVESFYNDPLYIEAVTDNVHAGLARFGGVAPEEIEIVFSAHGVPLSLIKAGDPYQSQIQEMVRLVVERGAWKSPHTLCYQSKVGPAEWLTPSLTETLKQLADRGRKRLLVVPVSFVTDHIETLHEINLEAREEAEAHGVVQFELAPPLNSQPKFIRCLANLVLQKVRE